METTEKVERHILEYAQMSSEWTVKLTFWVGFMGGGITSFIANHGEDIILTGVLSLVSGGCLGGMNLLWKGIARWLKDRRINRQKDITPP